MIRVFLADDHTIVRQGLRQLLSQCEDLEVVGEATDGHQVLNAPGYQTWDVLVLDLSLPKMSGMEVLNLMLRKRPDLWVVVLSMYPEEQYGPRLLAAGAGAYLSKDRPAAELLSAIRRAKSPDRALVRGEPEAPRETLPHSALTAREYQIFTLIFQGSTVSEIAAELNLAASTVSNHVHQVKAKLGARSIAEIVTYAHRAGLID